MAFDGITVAAVTAELKKELEGGRLSKVAQPEKDELLLTIKGREKNFRLLLSADASLPLAYLTEDNKPSPLSAPNFCMLLRKHIQGGRIVSITQPGLERCIRMEVEHLDEMGDLCRKFLIIEIMGKHSNIIFTDEKDVIIDSIKRVSAIVSSVREVLPGKQYFIPQTTGKLELGETGEATFIQTVSGKPTSLYKAIYGSFTGISPILAQELCYRVGLDGEMSTAAFSSAQLSALYREAGKLLQQVKDGDFSPCIAYRDKQPVEFAAVPLTIYENDTERLEQFESISAVLSRFYKEKNEIARIRQRSVDLRHIVTTALERNVKKYDLQCRQIQDTEDRDKYRIRGELLNTYGYSAKPGDKSLTVLNYYTNEEETIPLDETLSATENAQRYFDKYNKQKRTYEALVKLTEEVREEIEHLRSILASLDIARAEEDLVEIREELAQSGYIRKAGNGRKVKITSKPFHYVSSDGYDMYVGRNNFQNDELTFKFANGGDWWFHAKKMPGSHVILRSKGKDDAIPDRAYEEAARLAAYYSSGRDQEKVEVDYVIKKEVKKPAGAKPGFVVYYTNYSMVAPTDISELKEVKD